MPTGTAETFQHYQVLRRPDGTLWELGRGAMGVTYKAFDTNLRSHVCLKVINGAHLDSESARGRFLREARAAAGLRHRNVASVYHLGNDDQSFFYAMEFVDGETVEGLVKRGGPLRTEEALDITLQVARALGAAHRQGLVHRDIKPANLMVAREDEEEDERLVKVIDFGLARPAANAEGSAHITLGGFVGTPQYSSPEQLQEQDLDTRSDIYSLGITFWYMLAGRPPFTGPLGNVFVQHLTKPPPWDHLGLPADHPVRPLLARMLAKEPTGRPQTPTELRREIELCSRALTAAQQDPATAFTPARAIRPAASPSGVETKAPGPADDTAAPRAVPEDTAVVDTDARTAGEPVVAHVPVADFLANSRPPASEPEPDDHSPEFSAVTVAPSEVPAAEAPPPVGVNTVLAGRYRLDHLAGEGSNGRVFQARDLTGDEGRAVAVKLLHPDVVPGEDGFHALEEDLAKIRAFPHPALLTLDGLERDGDHVFLVGEWVNGFTLVDLLRHRGQLAPREVLRLLESAAAAADHARLHGLHGLQLSPRTILTKFPDSAADGTRGTDGEGTRAVMAMDLDRWPEFTLKLDPLGLAPANGEEYVTWAGDRTLLPDTRHGGAGGTEGDRRTVSRDTQTSIHGLFAETYLPAFAALAYELLSGTPPPPPTAGAAPRLLAVAALHEEGNVLLRRCLFSAGDTDLESAQQFCTALAGICGLLPPPPVAAVAEPTTEVPVADDVPGFPESPVGFSDLDTEQTLLPGQSRQILPPVGPSLEPVEDDAPTFVPAAPLVPAVALVDTADAARAAAGVHHDVSETDFPGTAVLEAPFPPAFHLPPVVEEDEQEAALTHEGAAPASPPPGPSVIDGPAERTANATWEPEGVTTAPTFDRAPVEPVEEPVAEPEHQPTAPAWEPIAEHRAPPVPVETFSVAEEPVVTSASRRVNPLVLAAGVGGFALLAGVVALALGSRQTTPAVPSPAPRPAPVVSTGVVKPPPLPVSNSPTRVPAPVSPPLVSNRPPAPPEVVLPPPSATPEPRASAPRVTPEPVATVVSVTPPPISIPAEPTASATPDLPPAPESSFRPAASSVTARNVPPEPRETPDRSSEIAAAAAAEARKRREREQQEQQAAEDQQRRTRDREQAKEREASEPRQKEREAKPSRATPREAPPRSEPAPKPRATPPPKKQAEKPKPPEEERQRGPAVPFMR